MIIKAKADTLSLHKALDEATQFAYRNSVVVELEWMGQVWHCWYKTVPIDNPGRYTGYTAQRKNTMGEYFDPITKHADFGWGKWENL